MQRPHWFWSCAFIVMSNERAPVVGTATSLRMSTAGRAVWPANGASERASVLTNVVVHAGGGERGGEGGGGEGGGLEGGGGEGDGGGGGFDGGGDGGEHAEPAMVKLAFVSCV